jgi:hypothetical protein
MLKNIVKKHFSDKDIADMVRFANLITPPTWNVFSLEKDRIIRPTFLNIELRVLTVDEMDGDERRESTSGFVPNPMWFHKISSLTNAFGKDPASDAYQTWNDILAKFGDGTVASAQLHLCPYRGDWKGTIVHELAHIAEMRWLAQQQKPFQCNLHAVGNGGQDHGPLFLRAFARMIMRTEAVFKGRHPTIFGMWNSFVCYSFELKQAGVPDKNIPLYLVPRWAARLFIFAEQRDFVEYFCSYRRNCHTPPL